MIRKIHYIALFVALFAISSHLLLANVPIKPPFEDGMPFPISGIGGSQEDTKLYTNSQMTVSNLYPNPADNYVELDYNLQDGVTDVKLTIRNVLGVLVGEYALNSGGRLHIDVSRLAAGVYFYTLSLHNKNVATKKLLIRN